jgi:hypothetical protein
MGIGIALTMVALFLSACDDDFPVAGPCYHEHLSPVLEVTSVTHAGTGAAIDTLLVSAVRIGEFGNLLQDFTHPPAFGVELVNSVLVCTVPFGFGTCEGHYSIELSTTEGMGMTLGAEVSYEKDWGNCPRFSEGATELNIQLGGK